MFDWTVYRGSLISRIPSDLLKRMALVIRNILSVELVVRGYDEVFVEQLPRESPSTSDLADRRIFEELELGVEYVLAARVQGDVAEFGSHGRTASVICRKLAIFRSQLSIHCFDSFQGLPQSKEPGDIDAPHVQGGVWIQGACTPPVSADGLRIMLEQYLPPQRVHIYAGWFSDTLRQVPDRTTFAMIHVDCDLYRSAYEVLAHVFEHQMVSDGCLILFDDWDCNNASPSFGERKAWREITDRFHVVASDDGAYGWAGHKFRVHSYLGGRSA